MSGRAESSLFFLGNVLGAFVRNSTFVYSDSQNNSQILAQRATEKYTPGIRQEINTITRYSLCVSFPRVLLCAKNSHCTAFTFIFRHSLSVPYCMCNLRSSMHEPSCVSLIKTRKAVPTFGSLATSTNPFNDSAWDLIKYKPSPLPSK